MTCLGCITARRSIFQIPKSRKTHMNVSVEPRDELCEINSYINIPYTCYDSSVELLYSSIVSSQVFISPCLYVLSDARDAERCSTPSAGCVPSLVRAAFVESCTRNPLHSGRSTTTARALTMTAASSWTPELRVCE